MRADGRASKNQLSVSKDEDIEGLRKLADVIHRNGSKALMQINHAGAAAKKGIADAVVAISPAGHANPNGALGGCELIDSDPMSVNQILEIIEAYIAAALRAKAAGFDGVEIHSAHGYLLNQFYSPLTNRRRDKYSGNSIDGRIKLHTQIIKGVRAATSPDFIVGLRLGGCDYMPGGSTIDDAAIAAPKLMVAGLDFIDLSGGMCFYLRKGHDYPGYFGDLSEAVKDEVEIPVITTGGVKTMEEAQKLLTTGKGDMIGIGRALLQDASWGC